MTGGWVRGGCPAHISPGVHVLSNDSFRCIWMFFFVCFFCWFELCVGIHVWKCVYINNVIFISKSFVTKVLCSTLSPVLNEDTNWCESRIKTNTHFYHLHPVFFNSLFIHPTMILDLTHSSAHQLCNKPGLYPLSQLWLLYPPSHWKSCSTEVFLLKWVSLRSRKKHQHVAWRNSKTRFQEH